MSGYISLGFHHIADLNAADHIVFLLALAAVYRLRQWRSALWVVTAFTLGHSITLGLAVTGLVTLPTVLIEFLIPVTILLTCLVNLVSLDQVESPRRILFRALLAGGFGLVHGAGFANYLKALFLDDIAVPLLGFNVGIEIGQLLILLAAALGFVLLDRLVLPFRARVITISAMVAIFAARMALQRSAW